MNVNNLPSSSQNSFELHAPDLEANPEPEPELEFVLETAFIDPEVAPALEQIKKRPQKIQDLVDRLATHVGQNYVITVTSPDGMYPQPVAENIPYSELLNMFLNGWIDVTVIHWCAM